MKIATLLAISLGLIMCGGPTIVQAQPNPSPSETIAPKPGMAELQDAIKQDPRNLAAYYNLADYYAKDEPDEVVKLFDRVIAIAPSNPEIYIFFSSIAADNNYYGASLNAFINRLITAKNTLPKSPEVVFSLARLYRTANQPKKIVEIFQQELSNGGDVNIFTIGLGDVELFLYKNPDRALQYYRRIAQAEGAYLCENTHQFGTQLEALTAQGKAPEAFDLIKSSLKKSSVETQENCISQLYQLSDLHPSLRKETIALIRQSFPNDPTSGELLRLLDLMTQEKQFAEIIQLSETLMPESRSLSVGTMFTIAKSAQELKDFEKAEKWYLAAETLSAKKRIPKSTTAAASYPKLLSNVRWHMGTIRLAQGKTDEAIEQFKLAISTQAFSTSEPRGDISVSYKAIAHNSLGEIYLSQGKLKEAQRQFESSIQESKNLYAAPKQNLAKLRSQLK